MLEVTLWRSNINCSSTSILETQRKANHNEKKIAHSPGLVLWDRGINSNQVRTILIHVILSDGVRLVYILRQWPRNNILK